MPTFVSKHFEVIRITLFLLLLLTGLPGGSISAQSPDSIPSGSNPVATARKLMRSNQNSEAVELLRRHAADLEKESLSKRNSLLRSLEDSYRADRVKRRSSIRETETTIATLREGNSGLRQENMKMAMKTLVFFAVLLTVLVLVLLSRYRVILRLKSELAVTDKQVAFLSLSASKAPVLKEEAAVLHEKVVGLMETVLQSQRGLSVVTGDRQHPFQRQLLNLVEDITTAEGVLDEKEEESGIKIKTNLNRLIHEVAAQAWHAMAKSHLGFRCTVVKDLEKILPEVEVVPADIRFVLFNLLTNAYESVLEKSANAPKGYEPKVTISSRKLPRFVQIRVKDTGAGIAATIGDRIFESNFSTKSGDKNPGLGLSESLRIMTTVHKGELFVESDFTNSTDFILRFPTATIM